MSQESKEDIIVEEEKKTSVNDEATEEKDKEHSLKPESSEGSVSNPIEIPEEDTQSQNTSQKLPREPSNPDVDTENNIENSSDTPLEALDKLVAQFSSMRFEGPPVEQIKAIRHDSSKELEKQLAEKRKTDKELERQYKDEITDILLQKAIFAKGEYPVIQVEDYKLVRDDIWASNDDNKLVAKHDYINEPLSVRNLKTLKPRTWLNDEVINAYLKLIIRRETTILKNKIHIFNTFYYTMIDKLSEGKETFDKISRITRRAKINISECNFVFIPVHVNNNHWVFIEVDINRRKVIYQDSMFVSKPMAMSKLKKVSSYISKLIEFEKDPENASKANSTNSQYQNCLFTEEINQSYPKQDNGSDCGIFMLKGIEFGARLSQRTFTCKDAVYFRYVIACELQKGALLSGQTTISM